MPTSLEVAILRYPQAFGLMDEEVNPLLQLALVKAEFEGSDFNLDELYNECIHACKQTVDNKIKQILDGNSRKSAGNGKLLSNHVRKAISKNKKTPDDDDNPAPKQKAKGDKISVKQLRYLGYLQHQLGDKPDYKEIATLTAKQATMQIKDLEKELAESK